MNEYWRAEWKNRVGFVTNIFIIDLIITTPGSYFLKLHSSYD